MLIGYFFEGSEIEKLKIYRETIIAPEIGDKFDVSCKHSPLMVYKTRNPPYCPQCGKKNELILVKGKPGRVEKELIGYRNFFRNKADNPTCGCYDCVECTLMKCPDCKICPCKECKSTGGNYPDLCDPNNYESIFTCTCFKVKCICSVKYVPGFHLFHDLKLIYTGKDFAIIYEVDDSVMLDAQEYLDFLDKVDKLVQETHIRGSHQIRLVTFSV